jgi:hypothetical protein
MRVRLGKLPVNLRDDLSLTLKSYTVALLTLRSENGGESAEFVGTGTLVSFRANYFVLTAAHVWKLLERSPSIIMSLPDYRSRFVIETSTISPTVVHQVESEEWGPDMALLKLPLPLISRIRAHKNFRNLDKQELPYRRRAPSLRWGFVGLTGIPAERGRIRERTLVIKGSLFMSVIGKRWRRGPHDYFDIPARDIGVDDVPRSFGGVSGGGLWHIILRRSRKTGVLSWGKRLIGVAFYQSPVHRGKRFIRCHGPRSLFTMALGSFVLPNTRLKPAVGRVTLPARVAGRAPRPPAA